MGTSLYEPLKTVFTALMASLLKTDAKKQNL